MRGLEEGRRQGRETAPGGLEASREGFGDGRLEIAPSGGELLDGFDPGVVHLKGPHGIPLLRHAQAGKQDGVVELLIAHGGKA